MPLLAYRRSWTPIAALVAGLVQAGCGSAAPAEPAEPADPSAYVLDFSQLEGGALEVWVNDWLMFPVDLREHRKVVTMAAADQAFAYYARSFCDGPAAPSTFQSEHAARADLASLGGGHVDDLAVELTNGGGRPSAFCYGFRTPGAGWTWQLEPRPVAPDPPRGTSVAQVAVDADADAFTLIFQYPSSASVERITLHARP